MIRYAERYVRGEALDRFAWNRTVLARLRWDVESSNVAEYLWARERWERWDAIYFLATQPCRQYIRVDRYTAPAASR
jgi:hypothetical protein